MVKTKIRVWAFVDKKIAAEFDRLTAELATNKSSLIQKWIEKWIALNVYKTLDIVVTE